MTPCPEPWVPALLGLVEPTRRGDPESAFSWTTLSTRKLAAELTAAGHPVSSVRVGTLLREEGFSLQANAKTMEGGQHADRDEQFSYLNDQAAEHVAAGDPVISVDTKKKELVGNFKNNGTQWRPGGNPEPVKVHDFIDPELGRANPDGVYDVAGNTGWVSVGTDHDTAAFAVNTIRSWWETVGREACSGASRLLITADGGGSNGYRTRLWNTELARLSAQTGLAITVCRLPPGTSKWNKIEHRLFSHISMNWRGRPLTSHDVIVNTIAATPTRTGLTVHAELDQNEYPLAVKIPNDQMKTLDTDGTLTRHNWHGEWNYTPTPRTSLLIISRPLPPRKSRAQRHDRTIPDWYHCGMAMTLRLSPEDERLLADLAHADGISKQEATVRAIREAAQRHLHEAKVHQLSTKARVRYADLLDRLGR